MPTGRRKSGTPRTAPTAVAQSTLSFNSKTARVTKPSLNDAATKKATSKIPEVALVEAIDDAPEPEQVDLEPEVVEVPVRQPAKPVVAKDEADLKAEKVSDAQLKRYWKAEEDTRKAPRVHQQTLSMNEKILRHFDLSSQYGPCIGIQRIRRWRRAYGLGLNPPVEVLAVLLREEKTSKGKGQMAYIDELAGGRVILVE